MISRQDIKQLANLACLHLSDDEVDKMSQDEARILDYVDRLRQLALDNIRPESVRPPRNLRSDEVFSFMNVGNLINAFPRKEGRFLRIPFVFDNQNESH